MPSQTGSGVVRVVKPNAVLSDLDYVTSFSNSAPQSIKGLPIIKPPYSRVTAIDLNTGDHVWMTPHGDGPRNHPLLKNLDLPPLGETRGSGGALVTKTALFVLQRQSSEGPRLSVFDKQSGDILGHVPLPDTPRGNPVTYLHGGKQFILVALGGGRLFGGGGTPPRLIAFALP